MIAVHHWVGYGALDDQNHNSFGSNSVFVIGNMRHSFLWIATHHVSGSTSLSLSLTISSPFKSVT
jgi:hypothetical protein